MQPVSMLMSNLNVEANTNYAPNALAAAQETGQSQEIVREGIRQVQRVQASEAAFEAQKVHRKNENDEREQRNSRDTFEQSERKKKEPEKFIAAPLLKENVAKKKGFDFIA